MVMMRERSMTGAGATQVQMRGAPIDLSKRASPDATRFGRMRAQYFSKLSLWNAIVRDRRNIPAGL
jgi:hypothetical protein